MNGETYLAGVVRTFRTYKGLADRGIAQVADADLFRSLGGEANSIAVTIKHIAGNQRSRWRDFLTSDGEKDDRHRDTEFELDAADTREALLARWEAGWQFVFDAVEPLGPDDLERTVFIRGEPHTVVDAIQRQLTHYAYHVGQIVETAKALVGKDWQSLSVPRGGSQAFNEEMKRRA